MSRYKAGSKAAERRLRKHAEAMAALAAIHEQKRAAEARLAAQEADRLAAQTHKKSTTAEAARIACAAGAEFIGPRMPISIAYERAMAADRAATIGPANPIAAIGSDIVGPPCPPSVRAFNECRAALAAAPTASSQPPLPMPTRRAPVPPRVTLHNRAGWWEAVVHLRHSVITIPFYQRERPDPAHVAQAAADEITTRLKMGMAAAKPRKPKAPALPGATPRDTAKIRRIERQLEGV